MKTIEQLLELTKNPYYTFTQDEKQVLDDFLFKKQAKASKVSAEKSSTELSTKTNVRVRNIVEKADTGVPEATESVS